MWFLLILHLVLLFILRPTLPVFILFHGYYYSYFLALYTRAIGNRLASDIFYDQPNNIYSTVFDLALMRGQIISDALEVNYNSKDVTGNVAFINPYTVCIQIDSQIPIDPQFTVYSVGILRGDKILDYGTSVRIEYNGSTPIKVCAPVYEFGTFFAVINNEKYYDIRSAMIVMCALSSFFYFLGMIVSAYFIYSFIVHFEKGPQWFQVFVSVVITLFCLIRGSYWIIVATGSFYSSVYFTLFSPSLFFLPLFLLFTNAYLF